MGKRFIKVEYDKQLYEICVDSTDSRSNLVESRKGTQEGKVKTWKNIIKHVNADVVYDIGSNYGEFLIPILQDTDKKIHAFEPNTSVYECLVNTLNNYKANNVHVHNAAIGDATDDVILNIPSSSGNASVDLKYVKHKTNVIKQITKQYDIVEVLRDLKTFVMKIDVEGIEHSILKRIHECDSFDSYCIMFEFNRFGDKNALGIINEFLIGKHVMGIANSEKQLYQSNFIMYSDGDMYKLGNPHDIIVSKNITWK